MEPQKLFETVAKEAEISTKQAEIAVNTFFFNLAAMNEDQVDSFFSKHLEEEDEGWKKIIWKLKYLKMGSGLMKVVHCKQENYDVYIGRPSKWGNPFSIGKDGTRKEVIKKYRNYILSNKKLMNELHELEGKVLGCWCKPRACHGDVLIELLDKGVLRIWKEL